MHAGSFGHVRVRRVLDRPFQPIIFLVNSDDVLITVKGKKNFLTFFTNSRSYHNIIRFQTTQFFQKVGNEKLLPLALYATSYTRKVNDHHHRDLIK